MKAMLLAAGFGFRLRPLTDTIPKCLVPVGGKPLLQIWLERLSAAGITEFLINTHYLASQVQAFVRQSEFADQIQLVHEPELLGTAATLANNIDFFNGEDGFLIHADNYCLADFSALINAHRQRSSVSLMTMMTFDAPDPTQCGIVELDGNIVIQFHEKQPSPPGRCANAAVYLLGSDLLSTFKDDFPGVSDFSTEVIPRLLGRFGTFHTQTVLIDVGTPAAYRRANQIAIGCVNGNSGQKDPDELVV